ALEYDFTNVQARAFWATALAIMEDYPKAVSILEAGYSMSGNEQYRIVLSDVYVKWAATVIRKNPDALADYLTYLERATLAYPLNQDAIGRLLDLTRRQSPEGRKARERLTAILAENGQSPLLHFAVGLLFY